MSKKIVNKEQYEINKPSELCQVMYFEDRKKGVFANFSAIEIDLVNLILYKSREQVMCNVEEFDINKIFVLELPLTEIVKTFGKYNNTSYEPILNSLRKLRAKEVVINVLGKNKDISIGYTSIIHKLQLSKHRDKNFKTVKLYVDTELVSLVLDVKSLFSKMFLSIQYSLSLKYSKLLYEILKDYVGLKQITIDYDMLLGLLNIKNMSRYSNYSYFNGEIIKPALKEINEKSDITVSYEPLKEKIMGQRKQVTKIKFSIEKQSNKRLKELGLIEKPTPPHKFYKKAKCKLDNLVAGGYKIFDEEMWIQTDINKNEERYESETRIDKWLKETSNNDKNELFEILAKSLENCDDPIVTIDDYKIIGVFSKDAFTKNPSETIELLNQTIANMNEINN